MINQLRIGLPSKGRLLEDTLNCFRKSGLEVEKRDDDRGYHGKIERMPDVNVEFLSAGEIARHLQTGRLHLGVTGEDLIREQIPDANEKVDLLCKLGFGHADVVLAVPQCWLDVDNVADFDDAAVLFAREHGRQMRIATKYPLLTRQFLTKRGVLGYRTVESLGATEGAPAAGTAEAIVDITTTGATLKANGLKVLSDGVMLRSQANLVFSKMATVSPATEAAVAMIAEALRGRLQNKSDDRT